MSRIGKMIIHVPEKVKVSVSGDRVLVEGPKGKLSETLRPGITVTIEGSTLKAVRDSEEQSVVAMHGMMRAKIQNMIKGVTTGFEKNLVIKGVGYKAQLKGKDLELNLGYTHSILVKAPEGIKFEVSEGTLENEKTVQIKISGSDCYMVGQISANIRDMKLPEPYKGKGVRYKDEHIRRKAGKAAVATAA